MPDIKILESNLGHTFKNGDLLRNALLHPSYLNERNVERIYSNQRLEFFGDSVLSMVVSEYIFASLKDFPEGKLTELRASVVCEGSLARMAQRLGIGDFLILGHGEEKSGGRKRPSTLSDAMEAVIAAVYLDGGYDEAKRLVLDNLMDDITRFSKKNNFVNNYKSSLQEYTQSKGLSLTYEIVSETGPEHDKCYEVCAVIDGKRFPPAKGHSKKRAELAAAEAAYEELNI